MGVDETDDFPDTFGGYRAPKEDPEKLVLLVMGQQAFMDPIAYPRQPHPIFGDMQPTPQIPPGTSCKVSSNCECLDITQGSIPNDGGGLPDDRRPIFTTP